MLEKVKRMLAVLGPGIFAIGYTIGTGSVTAMAKAGSESGLQLLWVLLLSCFFSGCLMEAYGRLACVTGETSLHAVSRHLKGGKVLAGLVFIGIVLGQYTCMGGILAITSGAIYEAFALFIPSLPAESYATTVVIAVVTIGVMFALMMIGRYSFFEKVLAFFVTLMGLTFIVSVFVVWPSEEVLARAVVPAVPHDATSLLMMAVFVGTTLAAPTFVTRPLLIREKGATVKDLGSQRVDAFVSASLMFLISGSIMMVATGAMYAEGKPLVKVLDMAHTLEPLAGRFAVAIFLVGTLSAGLSSIFPIMMVAPLLISDYRDGQMKTNTKTFKFICLGASLFALVIPILGRNPVAIALAAQVSNVFVLPLTIFVIFRLLNRKALMGEHRAGVFLNAILVAAFLFACIVSFAGVKALCKF